VGEVAGLLIGLIADTHIPTQRRALPPGVLRRFEGVDLILHAGDVVVEAVLAELGRLAPVRAVRGNNDWTLRLPETLVVPAEELRIGMVHIRPGRIDPAALFGEPVDLVVYGHTHRPADETVDGIRWLNPGSPTSLRISPFETGFPFRRGDGTVALLHVDGRDARFELLPAADR